jgi:hypothetical protein
MRKFDYEKDDRLTLWPTHLKYIFDTTDPKASRTVFISTYDTMSERCLDDRAEIDKETGKEKTVIFNKWAGVFRIIAMDEGHRLRHPGTRGAKMIKTFQAEVFWFITATPTVNSPLVRIPVLV